MATPSLSMGLNCGAATIVYDRVQSRVTGDNGAQDLLAKFKETTRARAIQQHFRPPSQGEINELHALLDQHASSSADGVRMLNFDDEHGKRLFSALARLPPSVRILPQELAALSLAARDRLHATPMFDMIRFVRRRSAISNWRARLTHYAQEADITITSQEFAEFLRAEIVEHSILLNSEQAASNVELWLCVVERRFFWTLDHFGFRKLRIVDILRSGLLDELYDVVGPHIPVETPDQAESWFSVTNAQRLVDTFRLLNTQQTGLLSENELAEFDDGRLSRPFISGVFQTVGLFERNQMDFRGFVDFVLAVDYRKTASSVRYCWRALIAGTTEFGDGTNRLTRRAATYAAEMLRTRLMENAVAIPPDLETFVDECWDMVKEADRDNAISLNQALASGLAATLVGVLTDTHAFRDYERREEDSTSSSAESATSGAANDTYRPNDEVEQVV